MQTKSRASPDCPAVSASPFPTSPRQLKFYNICQQKNLSCRERAVPLQFEYLEISAGRNEN